MLGRHILDSDRYASSVVPIVIDLWLARDSNTADCSGPIVGSSLGVVVIREVHHTIEVERHMTDLVVLVDIAAGHTAFADHIVAARIADYHRCASFVGGSNRQRLLDRFLRLGTLANFS